VTGSAPASQPELLEVGRVDKSHGLRGEVVVSFVTNMISERTAPGTRLWSGRQWLTVIAARPHRNKWLVSFDGVADRTAADALRGVILEAEPLENESEVFVHELMGKRLIDQHGTDHGPIASVIDNPASDLLELDDGRLVPLAFYMAHDEKTVSVDVPIGLLDDHALDDRALDDRALDDRALDDRGPDDRADGTSVVAERASDTAG
jgi:16S rRNA processing protein RimM